MAEESFRSMAGRNYESLLMGQKTLRVEKAEASHEEERP